MARGSADRYFQQEINDTLKLVPEGIEGQVPYKGSGRERRPPARRRPARGDGLRRQQDHRGPLGQGEVRAHPSAGLRESHVHSIHDHARVAQLSDVRRVTPGARLVAAAEVLAEIFQRSNPRPTARWPAGARPTASQAPRTARQLRIASTSACAAATNAPSRWTPETPRALIIGSPRAR